MSSANRGRGLGPDTPISRLFTQLERRNNVQASPRPWSSANDLSTPLDYGSKGNGIGIRSHVKNEHAETEKLLKETQAELICSRAANTKLEDLNNEMKTSHMEKIIHYENAEIESRMRCQSVIEKMTNLEKQVQVLKGKGGLVVSEIVATSLMPDEKIAAIQCENVQLKQKLTQQKMEIEKTIRKSQTELSEAEKKAEEWVVESQNLKDQLSLAQKQLQTCQNELKVAQVDAAKYQEVRSKDEGALSSNNEIQTKYMHLHAKELRKSQTLDQMIKKLTDENETLKSTITSAMISEERITALENKFRHLTLELNAKGDCEAELIVLKEELVAWKSAAEKLDINCTTPLNLEEKIREMLNQLLEFERDNVDLKHNYNNSNGIIATLQAEGISLREQLKNLVEEKEKLTGDVKKLSTRLVLIKKDRDSLRVINGSYEEEFEGMISEPLKERISQLQNIVLEYENIVKEEAHLKDPFQSIYQIRPDETTSLGDETVVMKIVASGNNKSMMSVEALLEDKKNLEEQLRVLERKHEILAQTYDLEIVQLQKACLKLFGFEVTLVSEPESEIRLQSTYSTCADNVFVFQEAGKDDMKLNESSFLDVFRDDIEKYLIGQGSIPAFLASVTLTYTEGLGQSSGLINFSIEDEEDGTFVVGEDQPQRLPGQGQGSSEVDIQIEGEESSNEGEGEGDDEPSDEERDYS